MAGEGGAWIGEEPGSEYSLGSSMRGVVKPGDPAVCVDSGENGPGCTEIGVVDAGVFLAYLRSTTFSVQRLRPKVDLDVVLGRFWR